jgi:hypothetical protein
MSMTLFTSRVDLKSLTCVFLINKKKILRYFLKGNGLQGASTHLGRLRLRLAELAEARGS